MSQVVNEKSESCTPLGHPAFNEGDIIFRSQDGILFKLDKEILLRYGDFVSEVITAMLEIPQPKPQVSSTTDAKPEEDKVIDIPHDEISLGYSFTILVAPMPILPAASMDILFIILELCKQFGCKSEYVDKVRQRIAEAAIYKKCFWIILGQASTIDDRRLGKMLLQGVAYEIFKDGFDSQLQYYCTSRWTDRIRKMCSTRLPLKITESRWFGTVKVEDLGWALMGPRLWDTAFNKFDENPCLFDLSTPL
ncbi:uncharacterized protein I206_100575 [Kwoniella pini CBS 10737]|uniref:BTB domain-containing protein n=1 Tax=Kwoniella pini CBS 10737 TaxID=1296096 RepID=A0A1B9IDA2_9TREE|nr:uncharacterized protein I206_00750 [Kwoniella pini CBS 10737]OCF53447.1 hypothetical protein I206_00750 [Kwoniella pini CBS 10737]